MPSQACKCGQWINYSEIPGPHGYLIISEEAFEQFHGTVDASAVYQAMQVTLRCPSCERLYVYWNGFRDPPVIYKREPDDAR